MMIDEKGKLFGKISVIDCVIILVLLVVIAGTAYKFLGDDDISVTKNDTFTTVVRIDGVKEYYLDFVHMGEVVYEQYGGKLGTITKIETEPYQTILSGDKDGAYLTYENRYSIYLTLASEGTVNSKGFYAEGNRQLFSGATVSIQSRLFASTAATIYAVTE
jgi:hypothetical protein